MNYLKSGLKSGINSLMGKAVGPSANRIQVDEESQNRDPVLRLFVNSQTENLIAVTATLIEVFEIKKGKRVSSLKAHS
jgi:hypothetical protein